MAGRVRVQIEGSPEWYTWPRGFSGLENELCEAGKPRWDLVVEAFYSTTQQAVHVITGKLKASGQYATDRFDDTLIGSVTYGNMADVNYAEYEFRRGGSHDAMAIGWQKTEAMFGDAMGEIFHDVIRNW